MSRDQPLKILCAWWGNTDGLRARYERIIAAAPESLDVTSVCISPPGPDAKIAWPDLDRRYRRRDRVLMGLYDQVRQAARDRDVLLHYSSWNLHPEFLQSLPTFNAYCAWDDPESSAKLTRPIAPACDAAFYGNVASLSQYQSWGCPRVAHLPIFVDPGSVPPRSDEACMPGQARDNDIILCCGKTRWRKQRIETLCAAFPQAKLFGRGWGNGFIPQEELENLYRRTKIGWNIHNSTGPINERLFALAAWGIMPLCDNRTGLAELFELDKEAVGFDTIPQAIDLTRYYLEHDDERAAIAAAAYRRYWRDYDATANWRRIERHLRAWLADPHWRAARQPAKVSAATTAAAARADTGRWSRKLVTSYQRIRFGRADRDLDERFYAGQDVPYDAHGKVSTAAAAQGRVPVGDMNDPNHRLALAWALTGLIGLVGDAQRIVALGPGAEDFARLASRQPGRQVRLAREGDNPPDEGSFDMRVGMDVGAKTLAHLVPQCAGKPVILVHRPPNGPSKASTRAFAEAVGTVMDDVRLFCLTDPMVPWLTPLEGPAAVSPVIVVAHPRATGVAEKQA